MIEPDRSPPGEPPPAIERIAVLGVWHLGSVTAACLAESGLRVVGLDPDAGVIEALHVDRPPVAEPGLAELLAEQKRAGRLSFASVETGAGTDALSEADAVWITFDTPVDEDDHADSGWVIEQARQALREASPGALVIVSSQLPVGSIARLEALLAADGREDLGFACVPENLRLGQALDTFRSAERFVAGVRDERDRARLQSLLERFSERIEWMRVESAEMTKHALNAFLATSVAFINEIGALCEPVGADAAEVSRGLKSDRRIGPGAYLSPGGAFAGGTLARDVDALIGLAASEQVPAHLIAGVAASNEAHREWARRALSELLEGPLASRRIALWGLTYKPGTDTLRRSSALELSRWLHEHEAHVRAHDPAVDSLPEDRALELELCASPLEAARDADALVLCTPWPEYREIDPVELVAAMRTPIVLDAAGHLAASFDSIHSVRYVNVGRR